MEFTVEEIAAQHEAAETLVSEVQRAVEALVIALEKAARLEKKQEALDKLAQTITTQVQSGKGKKGAK